MGKMEKKGKLKSTELSTKGCGKVGRKKTLKNKHLRFYALVYSSLIFELFHSLSSGYSCTILTSKLPFSNSSAKNT